MRLKRIGTSFFDEVKNANEIFYLILISLYVAVYFLLKFAFSVDYEGASDSIRYAMLGIVMWGSAIYLLIVIAGWLKLWKNIFLLLLAAALILAVTAFFSQKMSTNVYGVVFDAFFCIMAYGKEFKKILKCMLGVSVGMLIIAAIGVPMGITLDLEKPDYISTTHSLGINYPNTWGYLVFLAMMLLWYLYLRFKPVITFVLFWGAGFIMYKYISCNTIAALSFAFPVLALCTDLIEKRADKKAALNCGQEGHKKQDIGIFGWIVVWIPFLAFAFMLFASMNYEWMHAKLYGTRLHNFAMRFVQGGLYFRTYGFPLVGNPYRSNNYTYVNVNGSFEKVGILDSSFAAYLIMRGLLWMIYTLLWLCLANWKALKKRDYAIPFLGSLILVFAMMERPGLDMWYNFILLYPLAKAAGKPLTERVLEFGSDRSGDETDPVNTEEGTEEDPVTSEEPPETDPINVEESQEDKIEEENPVN